MKIKIIILSLLLILPLLFNTSCKGSSFSFDINGNWEITITYSCGAEYIVNLTFSGSTSSGDVYLNGALLGSYSVSDKSVSFEYETLEGAVTYYYEYTGEADSETEMEGDIEQFFEQVVAAGRKGRPVKVPVASGKWKGKKR